MKITLLTVLISTFLTTIRLFSDSEVLLPVEFYQIPFADQEKIVLGVKEVAIRQVDAPYNAALTKNEKGEYLLFFRYDIKEKGSFNHNYIAVVELDEKLEQKSNFKPIDIRSEFGNDPRVIKNHSQFFLVYNDTFSSNPKDRIMKIAEIDLSDYQLKYITGLDRRLKPTEKNWVPFHFCGGASDEVCFIYSIQPYDVLKLENTRENNLKKLMEISRIDPFPWSWGPPRGGTPAELVNGEYLTFFHSSFKDWYGRRWYAMGAFTFEAKPPFKITAVSPHPILFDGIYTSPHLNGASNKLRCIFPSGLLITEDGKLLVSCGENDSSVKIITFDQDALLNSLIPLNELN